MMMKKGDNFAGTSNFDFSIKKVGEHDRPTSSNSQQWISASFFLDAIFWVTTLRPHNYPQYTASIRTDPFGIPLNHPLAEPFNSRVVFLGHWSVPAHMMPFFGTSTTYLVLLFLVHG